MLNIGSDTRIYLYNGSTDMRKGINGLSLLAESILSDQFCNGAMFVFSVWTKRTFFEKNFLKLIDFINYFWCETKKISSDPRSVNKCQQYSRILIFWASESVVSTTESLIFLCCNLCARVFVIILFLNLALY